MIPTMLAIFGFGLLLLAIILTAISYTERDKYAVPRYRRAFPVDALLFTGLLAAAAWGVLGTIGKTHPWSPGIVSGIIAGLLPPLVRSRYPAYLRMWEESSNRSLAEGEA